MTTTWITICDTCKRDDWADRGEERPDGIALAERVERLAADTPLRVRRTSCLMGCDHSCNIAVQAQGKLAYTLGRFEPSEEAAQGIVDWALMHGESDTGRVPYRSWPVAVKGHFVTRHPPLPEGE
ncbi:MAG: DUF1636 family protein [Maritimibacter harenae]|jgi:predicted metal-binding protein|uniref:DUF1636 domain-containing protein n=1 Tax=Maritimibacter harenae TaxID=2606218 RepID=A0A845M7U4_9RHOB|nr:DUF1636 domain-containing protein [Maritimibacter harenae]MZR13593.1 DUF1636 domain-containing protein [Maritimibacter harenae]